MSAHWTTGSAPHVPSGPIVPLSISDPYPSEEHSVVLALRGALDHRTASALLVAIVTQAERLPSSRSILIDLTGVDVLDAAGVGCLVTGSRMCAKAGVVLAVHGHSTVIRALFDLRPAADTRGARRSTWCTPAFRAHPGGLTGVRPPGPRGRLPTRTHPSRGR